MRGKSVLLGRGRSLFHGFRQQSDGGEPRVVRMHVRRVVRRGAPATPRVVRSAYAGPRAIHKRSSGGEEPLLQEWGKQADTAHEQNCQDPKRRTRAGRDVLRARQTTSRKLSADATHGRRGSCSGAKVIGGRA